ASGRRPAWCHRPCCMISPRWNTRLLSAHKLAPPPADGDPSGSKGGNILNLRAPKTQAPAFAPANRRPGRATASTVLAAQQDSPSQTRHVDGTCEQGRLARAVGHAEHRLHQVPLARQSHVIAEEQSAGVRRLQEVEGAAREPNLVAPAGTESALRSAE